MAEPWSNWSGNLHARPERRHRPASEDELGAIVTEAAARGRTIRPVGMGHSFTPLAHTEDDLVSLDRMNGLLAHDARRGTATLAGGTPIGQASEELGAVGLALENIGDIDYQGLVGAIATGTHGTGRRLPNLAAMLVGARMITAAGEVLDVDADHDPELIRALRVNLGLLGILTRVTVRVVPAYRLERHERCIRTDEGLARLDDLIERNRHFDLYWYPRRDELKLRLLNPPGETPPELLMGTGYHAEEGPVGEVLPRPQELRYEEMEYFMPLEAGRACFVEVRARIKERHRHAVAWRVLYRTVASDDGFLSPSGGRDSVTIALLQNATLPYAEYFADIERIFRAHGGRPHWAKHHSLTAEELRPLYPDWDRFMAIRARLDPEGIFVNDHLRSMLGIGTPQEVRA